MCGPSGTAKKLNDTVQNFTKQVVGEAGTVFSETNAVFNNIVNSVQSIINGGPSQAGFSTNQKNAMTAAAVQAGGTMARNIKGATAAASAAIGGGNTVAPSGSVQAANLDANIAAAEKTAEAKNNIEQADFATGRDNYFKALDVEKSAPSVLSEATSFNAEAGGQLTAAQKSQQNIDSQSNWWKNDLMKVGMAGLNFVTNPAGGLMGGIKNMSSDSSFMENVGNFMSGAQGQST
jgi:hypothetical protein